MTTAIHGFCDPRFRPLEDAFRANFDAGLELGASLAATFQGKLVVDLWGGHTDSTCTHEWQTDTLVNVASTTKIALNIAMLMLVDRGLLELDAPVARYWPEFACNGKADVSVRDVMTHQAGVPGFDPPLPYEALADWETASTNIAAQAHWFGGRRVACYHSITLGFLIGELMYRTDGRRPARFVREEVAGPLAADFQIGIDEAEMVRVTTPELVVGDALPELPSLLVRLIGLISPADFGVKCTDADISSANGFANGRAIAEVCAILAMGGQVSGRHFVAAPLVTEAAREQAFGDDPLFGPIRWGLGFGLDSDVFPAPSSSCFQWGGAGGSLGMIDPRAGVSIGYAPNRWYFEPPRDGASDRRHRSIWLALHELLPTLA